VPILIPDETAILEGDYVSPRGRYGATLNTLAPVTATITGMLERVGVSFTTLDEAFLIAVLSIGIEAVTNETLGFASSVAAGEHGKEGVVVATLAPADTLSVISREILAAMTITLAPVTLDQTTELGRVGLVIATLDPATTQTSSLTIEYFGLLLEGAIQSGTDLMLLEPNMQDIATDLFLSEEVL